MLSVFRPGAHQPVVNITLYQRNNPFSPVRQSTFISSSLLTTMHATNKTPHHRMRKTHPFVSRSSVSPFPDLGLDYDIPDDSPPASTSTSSSTGSCLVTASAHSAPASSITTNPPRTLRSPQTHLLSTRPRLFSLVSQGPRSIRIQLQEMYSMRRPSSAPCRTLAISNRKPMTGIPPCSEARSPEYEGSSPSSSLARGS